jgi:phage FluMu protein Com
MVVKVKCPYCKDIHSHGIAKNTNEKLHHRGADCGSGSYYITTILNYPV